VRERVCVSVCGMEIRTREKGLVPDGRGRDSEMEVDEPHGRIMWVARRKGRDCRGEKRGSECWAYSVCCRYIPTYNNITGCHPTTHR
jgi:hypothetical protein